MPWEFQRYLQQQDIPSFEEIYARIRRIPYKRWRALFSLLYLTGARISEILISTPEDFELIERKDNKIFLITLYNEKHRSRKIKKIPIVIFDDRIREMVNWVIGYINEKLEQINLKDEVLWNISLARAYKLCRKYMKMNPHFLRHIRLTHLIIDHNFNEHELKTFAGWTDTRPAAKYVEMNWKNLIVKLDGRE
ncbi:MAG: site-specific integrase [Candidatus Aenigmatarchaeota archaeon]